jgi:dTMP kinase
MAMHKGRFITFEGPEKSGKSTQAKLLSAYLKSMGYKTIFIREPGSTKIGEKIRKLLLDKRHTDMSSMTEMLLYVASRAQLVEERVRPAIKKGYIVLCDRFGDSTLAYQGFGCGLDIAAIKRICSLATGGIKPDMTFLLDSRASYENLKYHKTPDRIELRPDAFHSRVRRGYFVLARLEPRRIKIIRVAEDKSVTQAKIRKMVDKCLLKTSSDKKAPYLF